MRATQQESGTTLVEIVVALLVFAVGLLGLAAQTAVVTRAFALARRTAAATTAAATRLERLRAEACRSRTSGAEPVAPGGRPVAELRWDWSTVPESTYRARLIVAPAVPPGRPDTLTATIDCRSGS